MSVANQGDIQDPEVTETPPETVTVPAPDDDASDESGREEKTPADRPDRKTRRANAMREEKEARETAERSARESNERWMQSQREIAELRGYVTAQAQQRQDGDPQAALNAKVSKLRQEAMAHLERSAMASKAGDRATAERELNAHYEKIEESAMERYEARLAPRLDQRFREAAGNQLSPDVVNIQNRLAGEFSWLTTATDDETAADALPMIDAKYNRLLAKGRPAGYATLREATALVAKSLGLGGKQAPTAQTRQRFQGVGQGEGAGGGDGSVQIPWGQAEKALAQKSFPHLDPPEAKKAWLKAMAEARRRGEW